MAKYLSSDELAGLAEDFLALPSVRGFKGLPEFITSVMDRGKQNGTMVTQAPADAFAMPEEGIIFQDTILDSTVLRTPSRRALKEYLALMQGGADADSSEEVIEWLSAVDSDVAGTSWPPNGYDELDRTFEELVKNVRSLDVDYPTCFLVKPSGPCCSTLGIQLGYPTVTSSRLLFGHTYDPSNPCLRVIIKKLGLFDHNQVFLFETFHGRLQRSSHNDSTPWTSIDNRMQELLSEFARYTSTLCPILLLAGSSAREHFLKHNPSATGISLWGAGFKLFSCLKHAYILRDVTGAICQLALVVYHPEAVMHRSQSTNWFVQDNIWAMAAAISGQKYKVNAGYFSFRSRLSPNTVRNVNDPPNSNRNSGILWTIISLKFWENLTNRELEEKNIDTWVVEWAKKYGFVYDSTVNRSFVSQLHLKLSAEGLAVQVANGHAALAKGRATQAANGFPTLVKGSVKSLATQAANGYPNLAKGRAVHAANGYPGLAKGRAVHAANGFPGLVKGSVKSLATRVANGHAALARGRAFQAANGHAALARGQATLASRRLTFASSASDWLGSVAHAPRGTTCGEPASIARTCLQCKVAVEDDKQPRYVIIRYSLTSVMRRCFPDEKSHRKNPRGFLGVSMYVCQQPLDQSEYLCECVTEPGSLKGPVYIPRETAIGDYFGSRSGFKIKKLTDKIVRTGRVQKDMSKLSVSACSVSFAVGAAFEGICRLEDVTGNLLGPLQKKDYIYGYDQKRKRESADGEDGKKRVKVDVAHS